MSTSDAQKPRPARQPPEPSRDEPGSARGKPTPVRELSGEPAGPMPEPDLPEASLEVDGTEWTVRVVGRSGRAAATSPDLLLLGFWEGSGTVGEGSDPTLEALVVGTSLADLSPAELLRALTVATEPPRDERKKPFFEEAGQSRRR